MLTLFSVTLFLSSFLLFCVQPLVGKWLLPLLGGVPSVWNTCLFFFQFALLAGYLYAHLLVARLAVRKQIVIHGVLILVPWFGLPFLVPNGIDERLPPIVWLLRTLSLTVGSAFLALSTTAPLLQRWFSGTKHPSAKNPYFLYAASNVGSLLGLLAYPLVWEPLLALGQQNRLWAWGYGLWVTLVAACGLVSRGGSEVATETSSAPPPTRQTMVKWIAQAFLPASLLMGVTMYLSTEVGSVPLLWVIPLALYLISFILVFSDRWPDLYSRCSRWYPLFALTLVVLILIEATELPKLLVPLHLLTFFVAATLCHGALAKKRPASPHLTTFYLCLSIGGALGGAMNAIVFPVIFSRIAEYPLFLVLIAFVREPIGRKNQPRDTPLDLRYAAGLGAMTLAMVFALRGGWLAISRVSTFLALGIPALLCYRFIARPVRFAVTFAALSLAGLGMPSVAGKTLFVARNFFGVLRVTQDPDAPFRQLVHGNTLHGRQSLDPAQAREPLLYYSRSGPAGHLFQAYRARGITKGVAIVGLGTGSMACYAEPNEPWTFYEIDPAVIEVARREFTFLPLCAPEAKLVVGDARLEIQKTPDQSVGLLVIDAFSSDAIPVHLVTKEALALYETKLIPGGLLAFHISNRHLDLKPVLARLARELGLTVRVRHDSTLTEAEIRRGLATTEWVVMARTDAELGLLEKDRRWTKPTRGGDRAHWTDGYSNVMSVLKW